MLLLNLTQLKANSGLQIPLILSEVKGMKYSQFNKHIEKIDHHIKMMEHNASCLRSELWELRLAFVEGVLPEEFKDKGEDNGQDEVPF